MRELREAPRLGVDDLAARRDRVVVAVAASARTRVAAETGAKDTSTATDGSEPLRAGPDPVYRSRTQIQSPASPTGLPVGDDAALWSFVSLRRAAPTKTKAPGVEAVEAAPGPR